MSQFATLIAITTTNTPQEFIQELVNCKANVRIYDFMLELKARFYPEINMILYEDLSPYVGREEEFCIDARMFYKYSKLHVDDYEFNLATADTKSNIRDVLKGSRMKKGVDFDLLIDQEVRIQGGTVETKRYMMTPDAFYLLLMDIPDRYRQARKTFCKYHAFQTKVIKYYDTFQLELKQLKEVEHLQLLGMKDIKIDNLQEEIREQFKKSDQQAEEARIGREEDRQRIIQLLEFGNKITGQVETVQLTLEMKTEELAESIDYLIDKSYHSTIDPMDSDKVTHIAVLAPDNDNRKGRTILVRGQLKRINQVKYETRETHSPIIDTTYNANAINLIENAKQEFNQLRQKYLDIYNIPTVAYNERLKKEIAIHNKMLLKHNKANPKSPMIKRYFSHEKKPLLTKNDIPITFNNTWIWYSPNIHIDYESVISCITSVNKKTQTSPVKPQ